MGPLLVKGPYGILTLQAYMGWSDSVLQEVNCALPIQTRPQRPDHHASDTCRV